MSNPAITAGFNVVLIVIFLSLILFGIVLSQGMHYFVNYPNDRLWLKVFVGYILLLDLLSTIEACAWPYYVLVANWGDATAIMSSSWILALNAGFIGLMAFSVQNFLAWRLWRITGSPLLTLLVTAGALTAFVNAIGTSVWASIARSFDDYPTLKPMGIVWLASSVTTDVLLTMGLSWTLKKRKGKFVQTNHILDRIVRLSVQNGLLTSLVALTDLVLFSVLGSPSHTVSFVLPKLYSNTVLLSLNSRPISRPDNNSVSMSNLTGQESTYYQDSQVKHGMRTRPSTPGHELAIRVDTERAQVSHTPRTADWTAARQAIGAVPMPRTPRFDSNL